MLNRTIRLILLVIILTTVVAGVNVGCNKRNKVTIGEYNMAATALKIPPIDTLIPVKLETATFALG